MKKFFRLLLVPFIIAFIIALLVIFLVLTVVAGILKILSHFFNNSLFIVQTFLKAFFQAAMDKGNVK